MCGSEVDGSTLSSTHNFAPAEPLVLPDGKGGSVRIASARLDLEAGSGPKHRVTQSFPEHPDLPAQVDEYEIVSGAFLGDPKPGPQGP